MFQKGFSFGGMLLLCGAAVLTMPGLSQAQHGGGGHGGGGHFGGGGGHFGGSVSHFSGGGYGGYHGGLYHGGTYYHGSHYGYGHYGRNYGGYGYFPYYGLYGGYYPYYSGALNPTYDSGYSDPYGQMAPDYGYAANPIAPADGAYQAFYPPSTATGEPDTPAHLTVIPPADAHLWFNGTQSTVTGTVRQFESPPLGAGKYTYDVQARWIENGHEVTQTQRVEVAAGAQVIVTFPVPPKTA